MTTKSDGFLSAAAALAVANLKPRLWPLSFFRLLSLRVLLFQPKRPSINTQHSSGASSLTCELSLIFYESAAAVTNAVSCRG